MLAVNMLPVNVSDRSAAVRDTRASRTFDLFATIRHAPPHDDLMNHAVAECCDLFKMTNCASE